MINYWEKKTSKSLKTGFVWFWFKRKSRIPITWSYSHLSSTRAGWNKRVGWAKFFAYYMKKSKQVGQKFRFYIKKCEQGGAKSQKSISEASHLLDRWEYINDCNYFLQSLCKYRVFDLKIRDLPMEYYFSRYRFFSTIGIGIGRRF